MPTARNDDELKAMLGSPITKAMNYVMRKIYDENIASIYSVVYSAYSPQDYVRTGNFYKMWKVATKMGKGNMWNIGTFEYDPSVDNVGSGFGQHHSIIDGAPSSDYLAEILYEGKGGTAWKGNNPTRRKRNAYKELVKRIGKRKLLQWFSEGLSQQGVQYQRHNVGLQVTESN